MLRRILLCIPLTITALCLNIFAAWVLAWHAQPGYHGAVAVATGPEEANDRSLEWVSLQGRAFGCSVDHLYSVRDADTFLTCVGLIVEEWTGQPAGKQEILQSLVDHLLLPARVERVSAGWPCHALARQTTTRIDPATAGAHCGNAIRYLPPETNGAVLLDLGVGNWRLEGEVPVEPCWPGLVTNLVLYVLGLWALCTGPTYVRHVMRDRRRQCRRCAYPIGSAVCPECGNAHDGAGTPS